MIENLRHVWIQFPAFTVKDQDWNLKHTTLQGLAQINNPSIIQCLGLECWNSLHLFSRVKAASTIPLTSWSRSCGAVGVFCILPPSLDCPHAKKLTWKPQSYRQRKLEGCTNRWGRWGWIPVWGQYKDRFVPFKFKFFLASKAPYKYSYALYRSWDYY